MIRQCLPLKEGVKHHSQSRWNGKFKNDRCIQLIISSFSSNESILKHQLGVKPLEKIEASNQESFPLNFKSLSLLPKKHGDLKESLR